MPIRTRIAIDAAADAHRITVGAGAELRRARRRVGMSQHELAMRAGSSASQVGRLERGVLRHVPLDLLCRAGSVVGLKGTFRYFDSGSPVRDAAQLALLARLERILGPSLRMRREVPLPIAGDRRGWDARISDGSSSVSVEGESRFTDCQATARRIALKSRDDPDGRVVILVLARTAHNRAVLEEHREALRTQFPLDGGAVIRSLRAGRVPAASGIVML
jgi:transcriptional regulator with XRE-family HTH domain